MLLYNHVEYYVITMKKTNRPRNVGHKVYVIIYRKTTMVVNDGFNKIDKLGIASIV